MDVFVLRTTQHSFPWNLLERLRHNFLQLQMTQSRSMALDVSTSHVSYGSTTNHGRKHRHLDCNRQLRHQSTQEVTQRKIHARKYTVSSSHRPTSWLSSGYSQKTWTRRHDLHWQLSKCWTKRLQRTYSRKHWKGETTFRLKTAATSQQLSGTSATAAGQHASTSTRAPASHTTPKTRATAKRAPTVEEQKVQACSRTRTTQESKSATPFKVPKTNTTSTTTVVWNDQQDFWERRGTRWMRHHLQARRTLFIPVYGLGHPPTSTLEPYRTTHAINTQTDEVSEIKDECATTDMPQNYNTHGRERPPLHSTQRWVWVYTWGCCSTTARTPRHATGSKESKRQTTAYTTNKTGDGGTRTYTFALQELVSCLC